MAYRVSIAVVQWLHFAPSNACDLLDVLWVWSQSGFIGAVRLDEFLDDPVTFQP